MGRAARWGRLGLGLVLAVACAYRPAPALAKDDPYAKALARHAADLKSGSFRRRTRAWYALAETRDPRAIKYLTGEHDRAKKEPQARAFLVSTVCDAFAAAPDLPALRAWRDGRDDPDDAWLWYRVTRLEVEQGGAAAVVARLRDTKLPAALRGAALLALADWADPSVLDAITATLDASPPAEKQRALLVDCCAKALRSQAGRWGTPAYRAVGLRLVGLVADAKVPERSRLLLGRVFAHAAGLPRPLRSVTGWRLLLEEGSDDAPPADDDGHRYAPPVAFMDVVTTGNRIGFVVDASGSMEAPLTTRELEDLKPAGPAGTPAEKPKGPTTPDGRPAAPRRAGDAPAADAPPLPKSTADGLIDVGLRWQKIRSRYDAALEFVRAAVARLGEDVRFGAVLFGSTTDDLLRAQGLLLATRANLAAVTKAVDVRLAGSGTLGATNLHGGLTRMFRTDEKGFRADAGPGDAVLLRDGVDTVYVLSDGSPCTDDWDDGTELPSLDDPTTYYDDDTLLDDVERWNLFRHAELNVVSIGLGFGSLLERMAWRTGGVYRQIPRPAKDGDGPAGRSTTLDEMLDKLPPEQAARLRRLLEDGPGSGGPAGSRPDAKDGAKADTPAEWLKALESGTEAGQRAAARKLDRLAGRRWGFAAGMRSHERAALLRNWTWWLESHPQKAAPKPAPAPDPNAPPSPAPDAQPAPVPSPTPDATPAPAPDPTPGPGPSDAPGAK